MSDSLTNTFNAFEKWRKNRTTKNSVIPEYLAQQVIALLPQYSKSIIAKRLSLSGSQLSRWSVALSSPDEMPSFIELPTLQIPEPITTSLTLDISFANGVQLSLCGELNNPLIAQVIAAAKS